jgi:hypothetical protein
MTLLNNIVSDITEFFFWCSGTDKYAIKSRLCTESDRIYQAQLGANVFLNAVLAFLSFSIALNYAFGQTVWALLLSVLCGVIFFLIERMMVSLSFPIRNQPFYFITRIYFEILISCFLAFVIATTLELKIFELEIERQIVIAKQIEKLDFKKNCENKSTEIDIEIKELEQTIFYLYEKLDIEVSGKSLKRVKGYGRTARELEDRIDIEKSRLKKLREQKTLERYALDYLCNKRSLQIEDEITVFNNGLNKERINYSLLARVDALINLQEENSRMAYFCSSIFILFTLFLVVPSISKFLFRHRAYNLLMLKEQSEAEKILLKSLGTVSTNLNIYPTDSYETTLKNIDYPESESEALARDWQKVGDDLWKEVENLTNQQKNTDSDDVRTKQ